MVGYIIHTGGDYLRALTALMEHSEDARGPGSLYACMHTTALVTVLDVADDGLVLQTIEDMNIETPAKGWYGCSQLACVRACVRVVCCFVSCELCK